MHARDEGLQQAVSTIEEGGGQDFDDFDSIFGSAPASPVLSAQRDPSAESNEDRPRETRNEGRRKNEEISDIPRLKERHETEGYRDGVTQGKAQSIQEGFDEGYSLGAVFGLRIGKVLGLLEGIAGALMSGGDDLQDERKQAEERFVAAKMELSTEGIFSQEYWGADGIWLWDVPGDKDGEVIFEDVVSAHPLVRKWEAIVQEEVERWGIDLDVWEGEETEDIAAELKGLGDLERQQREVATEAVPLAAGQIMGVDKAKLSW